MTAREELHHLLDGIPDAQVAEVRAFLSAIATRDLDAYFAALPPGEESFSAEERASLLDASQPDGKSISLAALRQELESL
jgi:hypothetical protein